MGADADKAMLDSSATFLVAPIPSLVRAVRAAILSVERLWQQPEHHPWRRSRLQGADPGGAVSELPVFQFFRQPQFETRDQHWLRFGVRAGVAGKPPPIRRDLFRDKLPYPFEDMGEQSVKNIAPQCGSMRCALKPSFDPLAPGAPAAPISQPVAPRLSIVVLPFANLSNDPEQ